MDKLNNNKVVIIGLDGATFDLITPWVKEGRLPVLARLMQEGASGNLKSTIPFNSAVAWSSFITGKNPGKHGIFDFRYRSQNSYDMKFINSLHRNGKSLWKLLSEAGKKVVVFNVPVTYPTEEVNGCLISGLTAPEVNENIFYPRDLFKEVVSKAGMFTIRPFARDHIRLNRFDRVFKEMVSVVEQHFKVVNYLFENKEWDFFCAVFGTTDHVQHFFWHLMDQNHPFHNPSLGALYGECVFKIYKRLDEMVGAFAERLDKNTTVIIMSDHGAGANGDKAFYLNNWLAYEGLLAYKDVSITCNKKSGLLKKGILLAKKYVPRKYKNKLRNIPWLTSKVETVYWDPRIDWSRTKAFSYDTFGLIWVNLKSRELEGIVEDGKEYEEVRNKIIERALNYTDPASGERVFSKAFKKEDIYCGEEIDFAPDIILVQKDRQYMYPYRSSHLSNNKSPIESFTMEKTKNNPVQTASHLINGIIAMKGLPVRPGISILDASIIDIAPTVLYLMGIPVPADMDGKVLEDAIIPSYLSTNPVSYLEGYKPNISVGRQAELNVDEEKQIEETLRSLGYID